MPNTAVPGEVNEKQLEEWIAAYSSAVLKLCFVLTCVLCETESSCSPRDKPPAAGSGQIQR